MSTLRLSCIADLTTTGLPEPLLAEIRQRNTVTPATTKRKEPEPVPYWREVGDRLLLPRGDLAWLLPRLRAEDPTLRVDASGSSTGSPLGATFRGRSRPYQDEATEALVRGQQGTLNLPPGGGKTWVALQAIGQVGRTALILVGTKDLLEQWQREIWNRLGITAGTLGIGRHDLRTVTVATTQTLSRLSDRVLYGLSAYFGVSVYDEAHSVPARTLFRVQNLLRCSYRWGLSATPEREDGMQGALALVMGPELYRRGYPEMVADGYLMHPRIFAVSTGFRPSEKASPADRTIREKLRASHRLDQELIRSPRRNKLIVDLAAAGLVQGQTVLILTNRVSHANALASQLRVAGYDAFPLTGRLRDHIRKAIFRRFREKKLRCVIATQLADYGLDIPHIERTIAAFPIKAKGRTSQRTGRGLRISLGKTRTEFFDLVDTLSPILARRYAVRCKVYEASFGITPETQKA